MGNSAMLTERQLTMEPGLSCCHITPFHGQTFGAGNGGRRAVCIIRRWIYSYILNSHTAPTCRHAEMFLVYNIRARTFCTSHVLAL